MSRKVIMNLAMSLDGYIATTEGLYDWIQGDGSRALDTPLKYDFEGFLEGVDTLVMGRRCYDQNMAQEFSNKKILVATSHPEPAQGQIEFVSEDICARVRAEKLKPGKDIYLFGGGILIDHFLKDDLIDEFIIGIIPIILGSGRKLFYEGNPELKLKLTELIADEGVVIMKYERRDA